MRETVILAILACLAFGQAANQAEVQFQAAIQAEVIDGDLKTAIERYQRIVTTFPSDRPVVAKALVRMGQCYDRLGDAQAREARRAYERVVHEFADQKETAELARTLLAATDRGPRRPGGVTEEQVWVLSETPLPVPRPPSQDGRHILYTDIGGQRLKLRDLVTGENRVIVERGSGFFFASPAISPDGRRIAYTRFKRPPLAGSDFELCVAGIDGSGTKVLVGDKTAVVSALAWSPDGRHLLVRIGSASTGASLGLVPVAGGSVRTLTTGDEDSNGCFSPDGTYIVTYPPQRDGGRRPPGGFRLRPVDGRTEGSLLESPARNWAPFWTPDGRRLVFLSDRSGTTDLWAVRVSNGKVAGEPELVRPNVGLMDPLGFTSDGAFYYTTSYISEQDVWVADLDPQTGRALSKIERVSQRAVGRSGLSVAWSPDGQWLAYTREVPENPGRVIWTTARIILRSDRTGEERDIVPVHSLLRESSISELHWSPDGRFLLVNVMDDARQSRLLRIDAQTAETTAVTDLAGAGERVPYASLSRDGRALFSVQTGAGEPARLVRRDLQTGEVRELYRARYLENPALSPDGRDLLVQGDYQNLNTMSLLILPAEGGAVRELYRSKEWMSAHVWTSNGRRVLFAPVSRSGPQMLMSIPIEGGEPQPTGVSLRIMHGLALRPDGRRLAISAGGEGVPGKVWVIRNLFSAPGPAGK